MTLSMDLGVRIHEARQAGEPTADVADRFAVSPAFVRRLMQRHRATGSPAPSTARRGPAPRLAGRAPEPPVNGPDVRPAGRGHHSGGRLPNLSVVIAYLCMHYLGLGERDAVDALVRESLDYAERLRDHHQTGEALTVLAMLNCFRADHPAAGGWAARMIETARQSGNALHVA